MPATTQVPMVTAVVNSTNASKLPESLGWSREGGNWLVGLSFAALGGGLVYLDRMLSSPQQGATILVVLALAAFLLAVLSGVLFYFWVITYGNSIEELKKLEGRASAATEAETTTLDASVAADRAEAEKALGKVHLFHRAMLWSFFVGAFLAFAAGMAQVYLADRPDGPWTVQTHTYTDAACQCSRHVVLRVSNSSGATWSLVTSSTGDYAWRAVSVELPKESSK